jgi:hypothetical protein
MDRTADFVLIIFCINELPNLIQQCKLFVIDNVYFYGILVTPPLHAHCRFAYSNCLVDCQLS